MLVIQIRGEKSLIDDTCGEKAMALARKEVIRLLAKDGEKERRRERWMVTGCEIGNKGFTDAGFREAYVP